MRAVRRARRACSRTHRRRRHDARLLADAHVLAVQQSASPPLPADTPLSRFLVRCWEARCWALLEPAQGVALYDDLLRDWPHAVGRRDGSLYQTRLAIACAASGQLDRARAVGRKALTTARATQSATAARELRQLPTSCAPYAAWTERRSDGSSASITARQQAREATSRCLLARPPDVRCRSPRRTGGSAGALAPSAARSAARKPSTTLRFRT
jgi:hypothetical protein